MTASAIDRAVFARLGEITGDDPEFLAELVDTYLADGDRVAAFGVYTGIYRKTGKAMRATFAHLYQLKSGKIVSMEQYVDSATVQGAMLMPI